MLQFERRKSLEPPESPGISWEEYISTPAGQAPELGRTHVAKESSKAFKATIAMVSVMVTLVLWLGINILD